MTSPKAPSWPVLLSLAGVALLGIGVVRLLLVWVRGGAAEADPEASVLGVVLAAVGAAVGILGWAVRYRRLSRAAASAEQIDLAAATLAGVVREQWTAEAEVRALGDPEPMPVRWRLTTPDLMDSPSVVNPEGNLDFAGNSRDAKSLADAFLALPRRRLVVTGGPGTGKTTLALQLLLELLPRPGEHPREPVPVLFSLYSWNPDVHPRLQDWLIVQVEQTYPALRAIAPDAAAALVAQDRILPVLDGLDEVPSDRRAAIIVAINKSAPASLIMTSRRLEFRGAVTAAGDVITASASIGPLALTVADAAEYLRRALPPRPDPTWASLLSGLTTTAIVGRVVAVPLGLWLVRAVYLDTRRDPSPLIDGSFETVASLYAHLLDEIIPALVDSRPPATRRRRHSPDAPNRPRRVHRPEHLRRWLTNIAQDLSLTGLRDWRWWEQLDRSFETPLKRFALRTAVGLGVGVTYAAVCGSLFGAPLGIVTGLLWGALSWLCVLWQIAPYHVRRIRRARDYLWMVLLGVICALATWVIAYFAIPLRGRSLVLLIGGFAFGCIIAVRSVMRSADVAAQAVSPRRSFNGDLFKTAVDAAVISTSIWLPFCIIFGPSQRVIPMWLMTFLVAVCLDSAAFLFLIATSWESTRRRLPAPWRVMTVLDDCYRLGLLRTVGTAYQFRHAELQDHFAPSPSSRLAVPHAASSP